MNNVHEVVETNGLVFDCVTDEPTHGVPLHHGKTVELEKLRNQLREMSKMDAVHSTVQSMDSITIRWCCLDLSCCEERVCEGNVPDETEHASGDCLATALQYNETRVSWPRDN